MKNIAEGNPTAIPESPVTLSQVHKDSTEYKNTEVDDWKGELSGESNSEIPFNKFQMRTDVITKSIFRQIKNYYVQDFK